MRKKANQNKLTTEQINTEMLIQSEHLLKTLDSQAILIQQLQNYLQLMQSQLKTQTSQLQQLHQKNMNAEQQYHQLQKLIEEQQAESQRIKKQRHEQYDRKQNATNLAKQKLLKLKNKEFKQLKEIAFLDQQILEICNHTRLLEGKVENLSSQNKKYEAEILKSNLEIRQIQDFIQECYMNKKKLNNQLQQLRGNIRVYCRIRPFLPTEQPDPIYQLLNENTLKIKVPKQQHKSQNHQKDYIFNFEQIFDMKQNQQNIFNQLAQLIQSSIDGKNVCIFAYGQTGSGKTYTMQGGDKVIQRGIISRSVQLIFGEVQKAKKYFWESEISVMIQEVYLEGVRDLLQPKNTVNIEENIKRFMVSQPAQVYSLLEEAGKNRKVAQTSCNEHSSRSHLIFTIGITSKNMEKKLERKGSLNLVDLAGSERVSLSKVEGERMKQTQAINKSLTNLGLVISALAKKEQHIPFRNSKLTFLLQKYLEGDSKTLMFVNISPKSSDFNQTICSLRFAEKVKQCKIKK